MGNMRLCAVESGNVAMSSSARCADMRVFSVRVWQMRSNVLLCRAWSADSLAAYGVGEVGALQCPPLPRGARIGEVARSAGGVGKKESTLQLWQPCRKAASRLWVNPFGSIEPLPLYRADAATQGETFGAFPLCHLSFNSDLLANRRRNLAVATFSDMDLQC